MVEFNKGWNKRLYINVGITNNINGYIGGGINPLNWRLQGGKGMKGIVITKFKICKGVNTNEQQKINTFGGKFYGK